MNQQRYKRSFGPQEANNAPTALNLPRCFKCSSTAVGALPVFFRPDNDISGTRVVCYKNFCLACGTIQRFQYIDALGNTKYTYAFFNGNSAKHRDFFLPARLYQTNDKADVGVKVRLVRALLRLQIQRPSENVFTESEVLEELKNDPQQPTL